MPTVLTTMFFNLYQEMSELPVVSIYESDAYTTAGEAELGIAQGESLGLKFIKTVGLAVEVVHEEEEDETLEVVLDDTERRYLLQTEEALEAGETCEVDQEELEQCKEYDNRVVEDQAPYEPSSSSSDSCSSDSGGRDD